MTQLNYKIRNKKTGEILPEGHYLYLQVYASPFGGLITMYEDENEEGGLQMYPDYLEDYEVVWNHFEIKS